MKIGTRVKFIDNVPNEPRLNNQTGVVEKWHFPPYWVVRLDLKIDGFPSGRVTADDTELIEVTK